MVLCISPFTGCDTGKEMKTLKLAHSLSVNHPVHEAVVFFAERVKEKSGGKLTIDIYPGGQLGSERELLELLQMGSLTLTKVSVAVLENFVTEYRVFGYPYLFEDEEHLHQVLDSELGEQILEKGQRFRLRGLCFYDAGSRSFYTSQKPVRKPEDLEGLKIRVMKSNSAVNMVNTLGGSATPIAFGELYSAIQQGVVDGAENNPPSFYTSRHYEVSKYFTIDEHTSIPDVLLISTIWWDALNELEKKWVSEAAEESVAFQRKAWDRSVEESLKAIEEAGVTIIRPDKTLFADKMDTLYQQIEKDDPVYSMVQKIRKSK